MPEITILRHGGVVVRTRGGSYDTSGAVTFHGRLMPTSDGMGAFRCAVGYGGVGDIPLLPEEVRLLSNQLALLADCIEAEAAHHLAESRKREALKRLKDTGAND
jgi:hypothetical protein